MRRSRLLPPVLVLPALALTALVGCSGPWQPPVPGEVVRAYRPPERSFGPGHRGVDLAASPGDLVRSPATGVLLLAGPIGGRPVLVVLDGQGRRATLEPVVALVGEGDAVEAGAVVGRVGRGGHCDGRCVHLGARLDEPGEPAAYLPPLALLGCRPVLLPDCDQASCAPERG